MKRIKLKMGITSAVITAVVLACIIVFNSIVAIIADKYPLKIDLTRDKVYEFSQQTKDVMKDLDEDIVAYALIPEGTQGEYIDYIKEYLDKYRVLSESFEVKYIDPYENPSFMNGYTDGETQAQVGSVIIECGDKYEIINFNEIYTQNSFTGAIQIDMEKKVTNAVMTVTGQLSGASVYFTTGHSEYSGQNLKSALSAEGYKCADINISMEEIPEDAAIIFSLAPMADFTAEERDALDKYMDKGGKFVLFATPGMQPMERIDAYLEEWGIKLNYDYVIELDQNSALASGTGMPVPAAKMQEHAITTNLLSSKSPLIMPDSMSMQAVKSANSAVVSKLLQTSDKSYGKKNISSTTIEKEDGDYEGPLCLAAVSETIKDDVKSSVTVIGSLASAELSGVLTEKAYLNGDFVLNTVSYLCGTQSSGSIRAKEISAQTMTMTQNQVVVSALLLQYALPLVIILIGLIVWLRRRYK
ncbi:MAG: GldG family protein [Clostridia bacterium]|nr:GldG family protein [Clostridia bacterium]